MEEHKRVISFNDLEVYQNAYSGSLRVFQDILPKLPYSERFDLKDQLARSSKAIPRLIAESYAKRHQKLGFQKYLYDAMGECNETVVSLSHCRDLYKIQCDNLIDLYDKTGRQLYKLSLAWNNFKIKGIRTT